MAKAISSRSKRAPLKTNVLPEKMTYREYERSVSTWNALREEVSFILTEAIQDAGIKIHTIESRVKEYESLKRKAESRTGGTHESIDDKVGARVICLFKSDLEKIGELIEQNFDITSKDDKVV